MKGIKGFQKGFIPWNKGLKGWTKGTGAGFQKGHPTFISKESYKRAGEKKSGSGSGTWVGGKIKYWINQAKIRDNYTCQVCGLKDLEIMEVDHIKPKSKFPELTLELNNLLTLCPNCHARKTNREKKQNKV